MSNDQAIEAQIKAKGLDKAPRVTLDHLKSVIRSEFYFTATEGVLGASEMGTRPNGIARSLDQLTFCVLVLANGFTVTGESACASPKNFDVKMGQQIAKENAMAKIWPLLGYELRTKLHDGPLIEPIPAPSDNSQARAQCLLDLLFTKDGNALIEEYITLSGFDKTEASQENHRAFLEACTEWALQRRQAVQHTEDPDHGEG